MALATQCPHCHTTFRVAHDQLKLRAGLVRCGACKQIFNGIENLLRPEDLEPPASPTPVAPPPPEPAPPPAAAPVPETPKKLEVDFYLPDHDLDDTQEEEANVPDEPTAEPFEQPESLDTHTPEESVVPDEKPADDPLLRMTLMDFTDGRREPMIGDAGGHTPGEQAPHDPLDEVIDDLNNKPWRNQPEPTGSTDAATDIEADALDQVDADHYEEPAFVRQGRRRARIGRILRIVMAISSIVLLIGLLGQSAYVFRDQIAARLPQAKPILTEACARLGCQVGLPAQIDNVSIESSELQTLTTDTNTFSLTVLLRNHGATDQAWPNIELTLNDTDEKPIARRVFVPREYLPNTQDMKKGFNAQSEQPVKLFFELSQLKAAGYRVYLFYP